MQVLVNTDNYIRGSEGLIRHVETVVESSLARFGDRITRVEVRLGDQNSDQKEGNNDKRCLLEARLAGLQPIVVTDEATTLDESLDGAMAKLEKILDRTLDRLGNPKGRTPMGGEPSL
ncbi:MAG TPA: HPF/RaiA family ribosome-associated protein [Lacipirellulaceae bacterium]|nr:HPF/RaiA family ribosome-associated protein [Lacipirellulaceae bacterium]